MAKRPKEGWHVPDGRPPRKFSDPVPVWTQQEKQSIVRYLLVAGLALGAFGAYLYLLSVT